MHGSTYPIRMVPRLFAAAIVLIAVGIAFARKKWKQHNKRKKR